LLGLSSTKGSIEVGKDADIAVFDKDLVTVSVLVQGRLVYTRNPEGS
jgi:N-acetylglucosamine-6-phosphate deacetylase